MVKSKKGLLTKEKLIVSLDEQPYQIPSNWCWTYLSYLVKNQSGNSKLIKGKLKSEYSEGVYKAYSASGQDVYVDEYEHEGDAIIVSAVGARCGKAFLATGRWSAIANTHIIFPKSIDIEYLYYVLNNENWWVKSGSAQPFVAVKDSLSRPFALPPLAEQHRIVQCVDGFYSRLDEVREKALNAISCLEEEYQAILHDSFTGKTTQKWRIKNNVDEPWKEMPLSSLVTDIRYGTSEKSDYGNTGTPVLRIPNIEEGTVNFSDLKFLSGELDNSSHEISENDILIIRSNGSRDLVGKCALVPKLEGKYAFASFLMRIKTNELIDPRYLVLYINSAMARRQLFVKAKSSSGIHNINSRELGAVRILVPTIEEQKEILKVADKLLDGVKNAIATTESVLENIESLKRTIVEKAIRGELGTNIPSEESSMTVLDAMINMEA